VGFFEERKFYPDFIMWVVDAKSQRIIFVEPHGMVYAGPYDNDKKAQLHERLPELAKEMGRRSKKKNIMLDSFIISATKYDDLHKRYDNGAWDRKKFAEKHILFQERSATYDYIRMIMQEQTT